MARSSYYTSTNAKARRPRAAHGTRPQRPAPIITGRCSSHLNPGVGRGSDVIETGDVAAHLNIVVVGSGGGYRGAGDWGGLVRVRVSGQWSGESGSGLGLGGASPCAESSVQSLAW